MANVQIKTSRIIVETRRYERTVPELQLDVLPRQLQVEALHVEVVQTIGGPGAGVSVGLYVNRRRKDGALSQMQQHRFAIHELADARSRLRAWTPHAFATTYTDEANDRLISLHSDVLEELSTIDWDAT